jgi:hypothetical protein
MKDYKPLLSGDDYKYLDDGICTVDDWFKEWDSCTKSNNTTLLASLLHYGLKLQGPEYPRIVAFYLKLADGRGYLDRKDYYYSSSTVLVTYESKGWSPQRYLADQAWSSLCHNFFHLQKGSRWERDVEFRDRRVPHLVDLKLAETLIWFFDPALRDEYRHNLTHFPEDENDRRSFSFLVRWLKFAWSDGEGELWICPPKVPYHKEEIKKKYSEAQAYYHSQRPKLVEIMAQYNQLGLLKRRVLGHATLAKLRQLAMTPYFLHSDNPPKNLEEAFAGMDPDRNQWISKHPEAAEILLMYPALVRHLRKSKAAKRRERAKQEQARVERERELAEQELRKAQERVKNLSNR